MCIFSGRDALKPEADRPHLSPTELFAVDFRGFMYEQGFDDERAMEILEQTQISFGTNEATLFGTREARRVVEWMLEDEDELEDCISPDDLNAIFTEMEKHNIYFMVEA